MIVKVCGMNDAFNIPLAAASHPDMMGFIFYQPSPRNALSLDPEVVTSLPGNIIPVGVFVNTPVVEMERLCRKYNINNIQLHGNENPHVCRELRTKGFRVMKAFGLSEYMPWESVRPYIPYTDMFIFDTHCDTYGGSGIKFDWNLLDGYPYDTPYLLSGGIGPEDAGAISRLQFPGMAGVDINSRFETAPGLKDIPLLTKFINILR